MIISTATTPLELKEDIVMLINRRVAVLQHEIRGAELQEGRKLAWQRNALHDLAVEIAAIECRDD